LVLTTAIVLFGNVAVVLAPFENDDGLSEALKDVTTLICPFDVAQDIKRTLPSTVKTVIYTRETHQRHQKHAESDMALDIGGISAVEWTVLDVDSDIEPVKITESDEAVIVMYEEDNKVCEAPFTHQDISAAVGAQLKNLPQSKQWNSGDTILEYTLDFNGFTIVTALAALVVRSRLIFVQNHALFDPLMLVEKLAPTVLVTDDETTLSLVALGDELKLFNLVRLYLANVSLSKGVLPKKAILHEFTSVRQIHSATYSRGQDHPGSTITAGVVHSEAANVIRALCGAHFVHSLCSPLVIGPIFQTNLYDYRSKDEDAVCFGPPVPCLEVKLADSPGHSTQSNEGHVVVAGWGVARQRPESPGRNTNISGKWGRDGCFYLFCDRPQEAAYSYAEHHAS
jgi:hypothetical protein